MCCTLLKVLKVMMFLLSLSLFGLNLFHLFDICTTYNPMLSSTQYIQLVGLYVIIFLESLSLKSQNVMGSIISHDSLNSPSYNYRYISYDTTTSNAFIWVIGECQYLRLWQGILFYVWGDQYSQSWSTWWGTAVLTCSYWLSICVCYLQFLFNLLAQTYNTWIACWDIGCYMNKLIITIHEPYRMYCWTLDFFLLHHDDWLIESWTLGN